MPRGSSLGGSPRAHVPSSTSVEMSPLRTNCHPMLTMTTTALLMP